MNHQKQELQSSKGRVETANKEREETLARLDGSGT
jgi:hypothetical protein